MLQDLKAVNQVDGNYGDDYDDGGDGDVFSCASLLSLVTPYHHQQTWSKFIKFESCYLAIR